MTEININKVRQLDPGLADWLCISDGTVWQAGRVFIVSETVEKEFNRRWKRVIKSTQGELGLS